MGQFTTRPFPTPPENYKSKEGTGSRRGSGFLTKQEVSSAHKLNYNGDCIRRAWVSWSLKQRGSLSGWTPRSRRGAEATVPSREAEAEGKAVQRSQKLEENHRPERLELNQQEASRINRIHQTRADEQAAEVEKRVLALKEGAKKLLTASKCYHCFLDFYSCSCPELTKTRVTPRPANLPHPVARSRPCSNDYPHPAEQPRPAAPLNLDELDENSFLPPPRQRTLGMDTPLPLPPKSSPRGRGNDDDCFSSSSIPLRLCLG